MTSSCTKLSAITLGMALLSASLSTIAAKPAPLTAHQSDPRVMGWMQGYPPAPDKLITQPDANYFSFPKLRWSVCHLREFLPTEEISRGLNAPVPLDYLAPGEFADQRELIDALTFQPMNSDKPMSWHDSLYANYTDGILIIHRNKVVYERYFGCLQEDGKHAAMSMTQRPTYGNTRQPQAPCQNHRATKARMATGNICNR
jgi:hypothetical protein